MDNAPSAGDRVSILFSRYAAWAAIFFLSFSLFSVLVRPHISVYIHGRIRVSHVWIFLGALDIFSLFLAVGLFDGQSFTCPSAFSNVRVEF